MLFFGQHGVYTNVLTLRKVCALSHQAQNVIKQLEGLEKLERLITLHLRDNQLETLDGLSPNMKCLQYLNVRYSYGHSQNMCSY